MVNKQKIINDAVHGFIKIPNEFLYDILQHRFVQRLNRIKQLGVSSFVYPSATHTRFQHSLGAMYLTSEAIKELEHKGHMISRDEKNALLAAILLHDIGHCPYSHVLENALIEGISHEEISKILMERMSIEMEHSLDFAIDIFTNRCEKKFLHQLVSSQLDMDRFDYLMRDSFFTGVVEGSIGAARIIKMLDIVDDKIVVERKGILSVENYLIARRFMYWQVYFHKTSISSEIMLNNILSRAKYLLSMGEKLFACPSLLFFLKRRITPEDFINDPEAIEHFINIDDSDIVSAIKVWANHKDIILSTLCGNFINRRLFKTKLMEDNITEEQLISETKSREKDIARHLGISPSEGHYFATYRTIKNDTYSSKKDSIFVKLSDNSIKDISEVSSLLTSRNLDNEVSKSYLFFYKIV